MKIVGAQQTSGRAAGDFRAVTYEVGVCGYRRADTELHRVNYKEAK